MAHGRAQAEEHHVRKLEALGLVDGEQDDLRVGGREGRSAKPGKPREEALLIMDQGLIALLFQPSEKALGIGKLGLVAGAGRPTQGEPSRFEALAQRLAPTAGHERRKPLDEAQNALSAFGR